MFTTIVSFVSGTLIPLLTKYVGLKSQEKELTIKTSYELELQKAISDNEVLKQQAITERDIAKITFDAQNQSKTQWINICLDLIRILFGVICIGIMVVTVVNLYNSVNGESILRQEELATAFFIILGYFFGERSAKKVWGK